MASGLNLIKKRLVFALFMQLFLYGYTCTSMAMDVWPKLSKEIYNCQCIEAFKIAISVFKSDSFYIYEPPVIPKDIDSKLVLETLELDISGGHALRENKDIFEKIPKVYESGHIYWQRKTNHGLRLVLEEDSYGWRGFQYNLFALNEKVSVKEFLEKLVDRTQYKSENIQFIMGGWRPPLIFENNYTKCLWIIDLGCIYDSLADWKVFSIEEGSIKQCCRIHFRPEDKKVLSLLPQEVGRLDMLLNKTIGNGREEGTLQPTTRWLIPEIKYTLANLAMRPWTLKGSVNSREQVDKGLKKWACKSKFNKKIYEDILQQYLKSQLALAQYYQSNFGKSSEDAQVMAKNFLDIMFRSHYHFRADS